MQLTVMDFILAHKVTRALMPSERCRGHVQLPQDHCDHLPDRVCRRSHHFSLIRSQIHQRCRQNPGQTMKPMRPSQHASRLQASLTHDLRSPTPRNPPPTPRRTIRHQKAQHPPRRLLQRLYLPALLFTVSIMRYMERMITVSSHLNNRSLRR